MAKILFAEDDEEFASVMTDWLRLEKYAVEHVSDGSQALDFLLTYGFDAAILDWELPGMPGVEVVKQLRCRSLAIPVIMLTGRSQTDDTLEGIDSGADDYLSKPVDPRVVLAKLKALLRRAEGRLDDCLRVGELVVDPSSHSVTRAGRPVQLYPKEFAVLEFLMRNRDRVFSPDEIISSVWSSEEDVTAESVRACVFRLRKKIDPPSGPSIIQSVYSVGYVVRSSESGTEAS